MRAASHSAALGVTISSYRGRDIADATKFSSVSIMVLPNSWVTWLTGLIADLVVGIEIPPKIADIGYKRI